MAKKKPTRVADPGKLAPFESREDRILNVIVETPMKSRNKFKYDQENGLYTLSKVLPQGMAFPAAFGFVPSTRAEDGDPEDILVLMDEPVFTGCVVPTRLIGVIEAEQTEKEEKGKTTTTRNDRLIGVADGSREHEEVESLSDLHQITLKEIEDFFVNYNKEQGKKFKVLGRRGPKRAFKLLEKSIRRARRKAA
jgi:inorganic pyrophosphatase